MRVGVFGGSFDPVHFGHLILAEQAREQARLGVVLFVPTFQHPLKSGRRLTRFDHRVEMLRLAVAGESAFRVDEMEGDRPGPSFTADTLDALAARLPDDELVLLVGGDVLPEFPLWHAPERIVQRAELAVMARPGSPPPDRDALASSLQLDAAAVRLSVVDAPAIDIASRDIRRRVAEGRTVRFLLPRAVEVYCREKRLYAGEM